MWGYQTAPLSPLSLSFDPVCWGLIWVGGPEGEGHIIMEHDKGQIFTRWLMWWVEGVGGRYLALNKTGDDHTHTPPLT
jgi:hypothetical protein